MLIALLYSSKCTFNIKVYAYCFQSTINTNIPSATFGVLAILAGLVALLLPETRGQILPDTLEEGELFGK